VLVIVSISHLHLRPYACHTYLSYLPLCLYACHAKLSVITLHHLPVCLHLCHTCLSACTSATSTCLLAPLPHLPVCLLFAPLPHVPVYLHFHTYLSICSSLTAPACPLMLSNLPLCMYVCYTCIIFGSYVCLIAPPPHQPVCLHLSLRPVFSLALQTNV
jgi:hypothetical protein